MVPRYYDMLRLCHVCASKCISWALAGTAYAAGHKTEMRLSASFEVLSGLIPLRSDHVLSGVASTILDGEVSTVTSLSHIYLDVLYPTCYALQPVHVSPQVQQQLDLQIERHCQANLNRHVRTDTSMHKLDIV